MVQLLRLFSNTTLSVLALISLVTASSIIDPRYPCPNTCYRSYAETYALCTRLTHPGCVIRPCTIPGMKADSGYTCTGKSTSSTIEWFSIPNFDVRYKCPTVCHAYFWSAYLSCSPVTHKDCRLKPCSTDTISNGFSCQPLDAPLPTTPPAIISAPSVAALPTSNPSISPTPSIRPSASASPSSVPSTSPTSSPTSSATASPSVSPTPSATPSMSASPSASSSPTPSVSATPTPSASPSLVPTLNEGDECTPNGPPCSDGFTCACSGRCKRAGVTLRISAAADDKIRLFSCGTELGSTNSYSERLDVTYDGACEDFLVEVTNTGGAIGFSLGIDKDGTTFGTFNELTVVGTQNPPDGWEQNSPGFDYSSFTPVIRGQTRSSPAVYPALLREFGASEVTIRNGNVPTGLVSGYKISGQYC